MHPLLWTAQCPNHLGKWQFSLICGLPEPPIGPWNEFISPQWDANDWCYNNITPRHNQLCILKREERCCFFLFLCIVTHLKRRCLLTQMHEKVWRCKHILFFLTYLTWIFILLSKAYFVLLHFACSPHFLGSSPLCITRSSATDWEIMPKFDNERSMKATISGRTEDPADWWLPSTADVLYGYVLSHLAQWDWITYNATQATDEVPKV